MAFAVGHGSIQPPSGGFFYGYVRQEAIRLGVLLPRQDAVASSSSGGSVYEHRVVLSNQGSSFVKPVKRLANMSELQPNVTLGFAKADFAFAKVDFALRRNFLTFVSGDFVQISCNVVFA